MKHKITFTSSDNVHQEGLGITKFAWLYTLSFLVIFAVLIVLAKVILQYWDIRFSSVFTFVLMLSGCQCSAAWIVWLFKRKRQRGLTQNEFIKLRRLSIINSAIIVTIVNLLVMLAIIPPRASISYPIMVIGLALLSWVLQWLATRMGYGLAIKAM